MRAQNFIILLILIVITKASFGQGETFTERAFGKIFKSSVMQKSNKKIEVGANAWYFCNLDSSYYKNDTLNLYSSNYLKEDCCEHIAWTFYKKNALVQNTSQRCKEPASATPTTGFYIIKLNQRKDYLLLELEKQGYKIDKFKILNIDEVLAGVGKKKSYKIGLLRLR